MPRNVDETYTEGRRQLQMGESEVDCNAAAFFFGQPVRIDTGQRADETRFPMIDVARGTRYQITHNNQRP